MSNITYIRVLLYMYFRNKIISNILKAIIPNTIILINLKSKYK